VVPIVFVESRDLVVPCWEGLEAARSSRRGVALFDLAGEVPAASGPHSNSVPRRLVFSLCRRAKSVASLGTGNGLTGSRWPTEQAETADCGLRPSECELAMAEPSKNAGGSEEHRRTIGSALPRDRPRIVFLSTYPPTQCGIATFTSSWLSALGRGRGTRAGLGVIRLVGEADSLGGDGPEVVARVVPGAAHWVDAAASAAARFDVLAVQHEYGIYGPEDGIALLDLLEAVALPVTTRLHTVLSDPSTRQRFILEETVARSGRVIVMAEVARERLVSLYGVDPDKVAVIPHGAHGLGGDYRRADARPTILTWGLIGPGKGIEIGILAMQRLRHLDPLPRYVICGQTHPNVLRDQGESYGNYLQEVAHRAGVDDMVQFVSGYMDLETLAGYLGRADVVLLSYDSSDQVTSGVLVEALGAGKPVVATAFPHAVELLSGGAGRVVPHRDPDATASALADLLVGPGREQAQLAARAIGARLLWPAAASRFEAEVEALVGKRAVGGG
jgi:glycosyltransferase involved in cell wall biosynthesis